MSEFDEYIVHREPGASSRNTTSFKTISSNPALTASTVTILIQWMMTGRTDVGNQLMKIAFGL